METTTIGNKIANARKKINISQAELAQRLFISPQAVGKWERGESVPDITTFDRMAEIFGVDLNYFSENFVPLMVSVDKPVNKLSWDMSNGNWVDADFSGLKNLQGKFSGANMQRCKFVGADMSGLLLKSNRIEGCDFTGADLRGSHFHHSHLEGSLFNECSLREVKMTDSHIRSCDFTGADFTGVEIKSCAFQKSQVTGLKQAHFNDTHFSEVKFEGKVVDCYFDNCGFSKVTFEQVVLVNTFFKGPDFKHIRFIDCQADRLTYEFLKSGKANLSGLSIISS